MNPRPALIAMVLISFHLAAVGKPAPAPEAGLPPLPDEQTVPFAVPFGNPVDGIALRLIAPTEVCPDQPINLTLQAKNVSQRDRYLFESENTSQA